MIFIIAEECLFGHAFGGGQDNALGALFEAIDTDHCGDFLVFLQFDDIGERPSFGGPATFWYVVDFFYIDAPIVHEEHNVVVGTCGEQVLDKIIVVLPRSNHAFAASFLRAIFIQRRPFHEALMRYGDHATLVGDDVFHAEFAIDLQNLRATRIVVLLLHLDQLFFDHGQ